VPLIFGVCCLVVAAAHMVPAARAAAGEFFNGLLKRAKFFWRTTKKMGWCDPLLLRGTQKQ